MSIKARSDIPEQYTFDLRVLFHSEEDWKVVARSIRDRLPQISAFQGRIAESAESFERVLRLYLELMRDTEKMYAYARLMSDTDLANSGYQANVQEAMSVYTSFAAATAFMQPELIAIEPSRLNSFMERDSLVDLKRFISEIVRYRPHTLPKEQEELLAQGIEVFGGAQKVFSQLVDADFDFGTIEVDGEERTLSHSSYHVFLKHKDRDVRTRAYQKFYGVFEGHKNALAAAFTTSIKKDAYLSEAKRFRSTFERSLFSDNIAPEVYSTLINTVSSKLDALHRYHALRKKALKLDKLRTYDLATPLVEEVEISIPYEEACQLVIDSLSPLGEAYTSPLRDGLVNRRWVDVFENKGKRSGAYSFPCYDGMPYILMNYEEKDIRDLFTLAHEVGHSMHSYFSIQHQPFQDYSYTIFVAEVASTFNEKLLTNHLQEVYADKPDFKRYLLNSRIDDINGTLFRQTMFAEFERAVHARAEQRQPLTVDVYRGLFKELLSKYYGPDVEISEFDDLLGLRIPHYYSAFYVYKYATGISAALALASQVENEVAGAKDRYLNFLTTGCSKFPLELLEDAGVDMRSPEPIELALESFSALVTDLEKELND